MPRFESKGECLALVVVQLEAGYLIHAELLVSSAMIACIYLSPLTAMVAQSVGPPSLEASTFWERSSRPLESGPSARFPGPTVLTSIT